ncbi:MAG TPA: hypothetical protein VFE47_01275 [Tepidisphaeraceae bacterium]|nr:hypothetical protein [Tepidisphaeraceae bacterium]
MPGLIGMNFGRSGDLTSARRYLNGIHEPLKRAIFCAGVARGGNRQAAVAGGDSG